MVTLVQLEIEMVGTGFCEYWVQGFRALGPSTWTLSPIALGIAIIGPDYYALSQTKVNLQK